MNEASQSQDVLGDETFLVLNAIYLRKMAGPEHVADVTGLAPDRVRELLVGAAANDWTIDVGGQAMLSDAGRARVLAHYRDAYAAARDAAALTGWYERFEARNAQFIKLVTEWQHSDGDERVTERLIRLVERQVAALHEIEPHVPRYAGYAARFEAGLGKVDSGQRDYVCKPTIDSVHNVWFEFHEDILAVLGRPREA